MKPISILGLVCLLIVHVKAPAQGPSPAETAFGLQVPAPGADALADEVLQQAIDKVVAAGGGTVILGAGDFKLSRKAGDETVSIKSNVTLRGQGYATHIYLDPQTPPNALRYYPVRIGTETTPANNVVVENLRYTGNNAKIGGGSIMGFNARLGAPEARLLSSNNVTVRNCWIYDAQQAAGCTKENVHVYGDADRLATQFTNWQVCHNYIDTCGNKAVELAECNGGLIADNYITNTKDGPQVICGSRNVQIRDNVVYYTDTGINITEGSNHIRVSGNHVEPVQAIRKETLAPCLFFRTEPQANKSVIADVVVTGHIFRNQNTRSKCTMRFQTRKEAIACAYQGITFTGNVFDGDIQFLDKTTPGRTTIQDIVFADNVCAGDFVSAPLTIMNSRRVMVRGNQLRMAGNYELHASGWIWADNTHAAGTLELDSAAKGNVVRNNVTTTAIRDHGVKTSLSGNEVLSIDP